MNYTRLDLRCIGLLDLGCIGLNLLKVGGRACGGNATSSDNIRIAQKSVAKYAFLILPESAVSDRNDACRGGVATLGERRTASSVVSRIVPESARSFQGDGDIMK